MTDRSTPSRCAHPRRWPQLLGSVRLDARRHELTVAAFGYALMIPARPAVYVRWWTMYGPGHARPLVGAGSLPHLPSHGGAR